MTLLLFAGASGVFADDDEPQAGLVIESTTKECSADYHIAREKGENPDEAEDRKRDVVGCGEIIELTLTGKKSLIGDEEKILWQVIEGEHLGRIAGSDEGIKILLMINDDLIPSDLSGEGKNIIAVQAVCQSTNQMPLKPLKLQVVAPTHITARHKKNETGARGVTVNLEKHPEFPGDGGKDRGRPGASAQLELTIHPTPVSFKNIHVIEKSADDAGKQFPSLGGPHCPSQDWSTVLDGNMIIDDIGWAKTMNFVRERLTEKEPEQVWDWLCENYVQSSLRRDLFRLSAVTQHFKVRWADPATRQAVYAEVSKFGCRVERDSSTGRHRFSGGEKE